MINNFLPKTKRLILFLVSILILKNLHAQISVTTTNSFLNNNGSGTVTFNLYNSNNYPIILQEFNGITGTSGSVTAEVYIHNNPVNGSPGAISAANGWSLVANGTFTGVANTSSTITQTFLSGLNITIAPFDTVGVAVFATGQRYFTHPGGTTIDSAGGVQIITGTNIGYAGGTPPATPANHPRGWVGTIRFIPAIACSGTPTSGNATASSNVVCPSQLFTLSLINDSIRQNLTYQWLSSTSGLPNSFIPMANDTFRTISKTQTSTTWYRCVVSCGTNRDTSTAVMVSTPLGTLSGTYTVNRSLPVSTTNFHNLQDIITAMNCNGITGPITINIAPGTGNLNEQLNFGNIAGSSPTNTITINGNGNTILGNSSPVVSFLGTRHVIWDSLNIAVTSTFNGFGIYFGNVAERIIIRKSKIDVGITSTATTHAAIVASGSNSSPTTAGNNARQITIDNNEIIGGYYSVILMGTASYLNNSGHIITNNQIKDFHLYGIYLANSDTVLIQNNQITRLNRPSYTTFYGIYGTTTRNTKVLNNRIFNSGPGSYTAYPIWFATSVNSLGFETEIINNVIYNITTTGLVYGMYFSGTTTGFKIYHNTVIDNTPNSTGTRRSIFYSVAPNNVDQRNNIFSMTTSGTGTKHSIYVTTTSLSFSSNRNVYHFAPTLGTNTFGFWGAANNTLSDWITASNRDSASVNLDPVFSNVSTGLLVPISSNIDSLGRPVGVLTDITGAVRNPTHPDVGAFEFVSAGQDLAITEAQLVRSSQCYSSADTVRLTINNLIGPSINLSLNPIRVIYSVNGPINTIDSILINTGTLAQNASVTVWANNVNMSVPGNYSLTTFLRPSLINNNQANDTLRNASQVEVRPIVSVTPKTGIANSPTDTFVLRAHSPLFPRGNVFISEICHWRLSTTGPPSGGWPSYLLADDYIEITGIPNSDLAGFTLEEWTGTALQHSVTFTTGTLFSPNGTMIIATGQLGSSVPSPTNFYYHSGNTVTHSSTGDNRGYLIRNAQGAVVDATVYGTYTFPTISGVTSADWTGSTPALSSAGNRLAMADNNNASSWINSGTSPQNPNALNANVPLPFPGSMAGFNWYYLGLPIDTNAQIVVGPYTTPGIYRYVALYSTQCGIFTDTVTITATQNVPVKLTRFSASKSKNDVVLNWQTASEINNDFFAIERSTNGNDFETIGYVKGSGNSASISNYRYTDIDAALNFAAYNGLFYRLNQFDFDGTNELSNIVFVDLGNNNDEKATVIPNPNNGNFDVLVSSNNQTSAILDIVDMVGNKVVSRNIELSNGLNTIYIDEILTSGVYTAIITTPHIKHSVKVVVSK